MAPLRHQRLVKIANHKGGPLSDEKMTKNLRVVFYHWKMFGRLFNAQKTWSELPEKRGKPENSWKTEKTENVQNVLKRPENLARASGKAWKAGKLVEN